jgi:hypothetical protein
MSIAMSSKSSKAQQTIHKPFNDLKRLKTKTWNYPRRKL